MLRGRLHRTHPTMWGCGLREGVPSMHQPCPLPPVRADGGSNSITCIVRESLQPITGLGDHAPFITLQRQQSCDIIASCRGCSGGTMRGRLNGLFWNYNLDRISHQ
ncbi:hypothetical protein GDO78_022312 [Eleutherodactylus coqui]|uniref:Uncharacterized protein n=1 Tax=Eleutherodactylus coqui TaxID=57060 RepID=A0A8J6BDV7_ELECQ|nr:hypothetical protein GDO78_022312 [Eleutherodactylus coqui]